MQIWSSIRARAGRGPAGTEAVPRLAWPLRGRITSRFGMRHGRLHEGIDIAAPAGVEVHAALRGSVLLAAEIGAYGKVVVLAHGGSVATVYAHLASVEVAEEDEVEPGRPLGTVGSTGNSSGAHLHFEVRFDGTAVDPLVFLNDDGPRRGGQ
jgi:murein DD-endopeptidase MepM/ murein hydrolase activator NlpD